MNKTFEEYLAEAIRVDTNAYRRSHMKNPGGSGNWIFGLDKSDIDFQKDKEGSDYVSVRGNYSDALKKAKEVAKAKGKTTIYPMP